MKGEVSVMTRGRTLWEILLDKFSGPSELRYYNPLKARVGVSVTIDTVELRDLNFFLQEIREYKRRIGPQEYTFVDYSLLARPLGGDDVALRLRLNPIADTQRSGGRAYHVLMLRLDDEFEYSADFEKLLNDKSGVFQIRQDGVVTEEFERLHGLKSPYTATVSYLRDINQNHQIERDEIDTLELKYWDFSREIKDEAGQPLEEYLFVEMDGQTGWIQIWRGCALDPQKILII
jgi:hypothetical protein